MSDFWVGPTNAVDTYRLVSLLGGGGEGEVWKAELPLSRSGRRTVAVKISPFIAAPAWVTSGRDEGDAERHGHLLRSLAHPGLVRVTDVFAGPGKHRHGQAAATTSSRSQSWHYVVMDYIEGPNLREWIAEHPEAPVSQRLRLLAMVAAALDEMHCGTMTEVAVAHGDVKPANIVVDPDGAAILVDLGLTRLTDTDTGPHGHSAVYAAPELRRPGAGATPASDRYAFAVTAAHLLIGQPPPADSDGWLDAGQLRYQLQSYPLTARRHRLVHHLMTMISSPPEARVGPLRSWLDGAVDSLSQVTSGHTPLPPHSGAQPPTQSDNPTGVETSMNRPATQANARRSRRRIVTAALCCVAVVLAGATWWATTHQTATASAGAGHFPTGPDSTSGPDASTDPTRPAANPDPSPAGVHLPYQANWSGGLDGWTTDPDWAPVGGQLTSAGDHYNSAVTAVAPGDVDPTPGYSVEADIQFLKFGPADGSFGLATALRPTGDAYGLGITTDNTVVLAVNSNGVLTSTLDSKPFTPDDAWHKLRLDVHGDMLTGFLDGQPILHATDNSLHGVGRTGLWSSGAQINIRTYRVTPA